MRTTQFNRFNVIKINGKLFRFPIDAEIAEAYQVLNRKYIKNYDQLSEFDQICSSLPNTKSVEKDLAHEIIRLGLNKKYEMCSGSLPNANMTNEKSRSTIEMVADFLSNSYEELFEIINIICINRGEVAELINSNPPKIFIFANSAINNFFSGNPRGQLLGSLELGNTKDYVAGQDWIIFRHIVGDEFSHHGNAPTFTKNWYLNKLEQPNG